MLTLSDRTRKFWCAAFFYRRAPHRDRTIAVKALEQVTVDATGTLQMRAANTLREIVNGTGQHAPRAS